MAGEGRALRKTITRPANATAYTAEDAVGDTGGSAIIEFPGLLTPGVVNLLLSAQLEYQVAALPAGCTFRAELFNASPTAIADNAAWSLAVVDAAKHIGSINFGAPADKGAVLKAELDIINKGMIAGATRSIFAIIIASGAFTPAGNSEVLGLMLATAPI